MDLPWFNILTTRITRAGIKGESVLNSHKSKIDSYAIKFVI